MGTGSSIGSLSMNQMWLQFVVIDLGFTHQRGVLVLLGIVALGILKGNHL